MDGKQWVKQVSQVDPVGFGDKPEKMAIAVEAPWASHFADFQSWFAIPVEENNAGLPSRVFVGQFDGGGTVPFNVDYANKAIWQYAFDSGAPF